MPLELTLTSEQQVLVTAKPMTAGNRPARLDGPLAWSVTSGDCTVSLQDPDGLTALIVSGDALDDSVVMVAGDADLGSGVEEVADTVLVHVTHANAASLGLSAGTPTTKP
ncbi:MAG TPA: hypothetical protein VNM37_26545 [Candidatus Dormibacteraeota bacterium]|nr:hypothetical protein [Candidatus Dormibacteraeota bacterium]